MTLTIEKPQATISFATDLWYTQGTGTTFDLSTYFTSNGTGAITYSLVGESNGHTITGGNTLNASNNVGAFLIKVSQEADATYSATDRYFNGVCLAASFAPVDLSMNFFDFSLSPGEILDFKEALLPFGDISTITYTIEGVDNTGSNIVDKMFTAGSTPGTLTLRASSTASTFGVFKATVKDITVTIKQPQTITFNPLSEVTYGDTAFNLSGTTSSGLAVTYTSSDTSVATISGNTVTIVGAGATNITASQEGDATYSVATDVVQSLIVNTKPITVTADAVSKIYGDTDPTFTYQVTTGSLVGTDLLTGNLAKESGEDVGTYAINQGTLDNTNYTITFVGENLTIGTRAISVTADNLSKPEFTSDPTLTYQITTGSLAFSDAFSGALIREVGEADGMYTIQQGTLALSANYDITFVNGQFTIIKTTPASALHFNGSADSNYDYITVPDNNDLDFTTNYTFEAWVNFDQTNVTTSGYGFRALHSKSRYIDSYGLMIYAPTGLTRFYHTGMGIGYTDYTWSTLTAGTWYHIAVTLSATEAKIYINGVEVSSNTFSAGTLATNNLPLHIGSSRVAAGDPYPFDGMMDEVRFWNTTRTASEISTYKDNELAGDETGLVLNYRFNQGGAGVDNSSITTVTDNSVNGYNGTFNQFALTGSESNFVDGSGSGVGSVLPNNWMSGNTGDWNTGGNWSQGVPTTRSNVTLPAATVVTASTVVNVNNLTIPNNAALNSSMNLNNMGAVTIQSTGANSGVLITTGLNTNTVTYERGGLKANEWSIVSAPVAGQKIKDFVENTANNIRINTSVTPNRYAVAYYDDSEPVNKWRYYDVDFLTNNPNTEFEMGGSYSMSRATDGAVTFTGTLQVASVDKSVAASQWNAIGNPFTAFMPANQNGNSNFINDNSANFDPTNVAVYVWDSSQGRYVARTLVDASQSSLAPGQGFFVRTTSGVSSISFNQDKRTTQPSTGNTLFNKGKSNPSIQLFAELNGDKIDTNIKFFENATLGLDPGYDVASFGGNQFDLFTKLLDGNQDVDFTLQSLPLDNFENMVIPIGVKGATGSEVTFSIQASNLPKGVNIYLEDRKQTTFHQLGINNNKYVALLSDKEDGLARFYLHTKSNVLNTNGGIELDNINIFTSNKTNLTITGVQNQKAAFSIYNTIGVKITSRSFVGNGSNKFSLQNLSAGVYIVQLITEQGKINKKIVIE